MNNPIHSENNTIKWRFENVKEWNGEMRYSDEFEINSVRWKIGIELKKTNDKLDLYASLCCCSVENVKGCICAAADIEIRFLMQTGKNDHLIGCFDNPKYFDWTELCFGLENPKYFWPDILKEEQRLMKNDSIVIEINFDFVFYDMSRNIPNYTDVILKVEDTELHFNKGSLCMLSEYFYNLIINENFTGSSQIKIDDVQLMDFMKLMMFMHPNVPFFEANKIIQFIKSDDFDKFLDLAARFKIKSIPMKISTKIQSLFETSIDLNSTQRISDLNMKCIKFADKFSFPNLLQTCLKLFKSSKELKEATKTVQFEELSDVSKVKFLRRFLDFEYSA